MIYKPKEINIEDQYIKYNDDDLKYIYNDNLLAYY
jgi:hypothetical protein